MTEPVKKRREKRVNLALQPMKPPEKEYSITDSLALQVRMEDGKQVRVTPKGIDEPGAPSQKPVSSEKKSIAAGVECLLDQNKETYKFEDLRIGKVIGEGSQAKVRKVRHTPTNKRLALKIISFGPDMTRKVLQTELSRCSTADKHPNLVQSLEAYFKEGFLMVLMEFMHYGTLGDVAKRVTESGKKFPEDVLSKIAVQVLLGLNHLHTGGGTGDGLIHRDLKPSNLLVNAEGQVKISDFGVATFSNAQQMAFTSVGSTAYMSPERVRGDGYTTASDIWSVGISLAEIALGYFPLGQTSGQLFELCCILAEERAVINWPEDKDGKGISQELRDFVGACMIQSPADRPTAQELLQHPYIKKYESFHVDLPAFFKKVMS